MLSKLGLQTLKDNLLPTAYEQEEHHILPSNEDHSRHRTLSSDSEIFLSLKDPSEVYLDVKLVPSAYKQL